MTAADVHVGAAVLEVQEGRVEGGQAGGHVRMVAAARGGRKAPVRAAEPMFLQGLCTQVPHRFENLQQSV